MAPYFITDQATDCNGWAVIDAAGDVFGCHATKQDAIDQGVAISLADNEPFEGERNLAGDPIVIADIDGTLIQSGERSDKVYNYARSFDAPIFIITGRVESGRDETITELENLGINYARLIMNDGSSANSTEFKKLAAESLLETYNVVAAIENNPDAVAAYRELGINAIHPGDLPNETNSTKIEPLESKGVNMSKETRAFSTTVSGLELRDAGDGRTFTGYAAVFDADSEPMGGFVERIAPGAFKRSLTSHGWDVKLLANHDAGRVLASTRAKTLRLFEDTRGLRVEASLPNSPEGDSIAESIRRGDLDSMSFGFTTSPGGESWSADGKIRTLTDVKLFEVSVVAWPAYRSTTGTTSVRSLATRADVDADELQAAIDSLVAAETLTAEQAALLTDIIGQLVAKSEADDMGEDMADGADDSTDPLENVPAEILLNQLMLKMKGL